jgi:curved DNA-binding protein CbpA
LNATEDDIRAAYRKRAAQVHPDVQPAEKRAWALEEMKRLNEAREVLLDAARRAGVDARLRSEARAAYRAGAPAQYAYIYRRRRPRWGWTMLVGLAILLTTAAAAPQVFSALFTFFSVIFLFGSAIVAPLAFSLLLAFVFFSLRGR